MEATQVVRDIIECALCVGDDHESGWVTRWYWTRTPDGAAWQAGRVLSRGRWPSRDGTSAPVCMYGVNVRVPAMDLGMVKAVVSAAVGQIWREGISDGTPAVRGLRAINWAGGKMYLWTYNVRHGDDLCRIAVLRI